ncbi:hypothetical protein FK531_10735 [Rhodococcus spelaei]|uniref:Transposase n=1 Tax=Rhodococcus spelaei TaxID=2546320 RepID=A0A541BA73_9NOCA|nr:hypothetical protein [Rhodococcus spelaei]TQF69217.1 hypothetical protein FK531_10735 [Rhodococcus spelaei]
MHLAEHPEQVARLGAAHASGELEPETARPHHQGGPAMTRRRARPFRDIDTRVNHCETWQFKRAVAVLEHCSARAFVNTVFAKKAGAKRILTGDAPIVAFLLTPMLTVDMHLVMVTATIRGWSPSQRKAVGLDKGADITYKMVCDGFAKLCRACDRSDDWGAASLAQQLLTASLLGNPPTGAEAVDSTDVETWARPRYSKVDADDDSDFPEGDPDSGGADTTPHTPRRHRRPTAPRSTIDGKPEYTIDGDALAAHRSAGFGQTEIYIGFEAHVVTDVPSKPGAGPVPHVARGLHVTRAGYHRGTAGLIAVLAAGELPQPREVICDRAYNNTKDWRYALPLHRCGYVPIVDLHPAQYGIHPGPVPGAIWIDGTLYTTCLPKRLWKLPKISRDMTVTELARAQELRETRAQYAFVPHGARQSDGTQRFRNPAVWHASIRSPLSPRSMRLGYEHPTVQCDRRKPDDPCACCKTVTIRNEDQPRTRMPFPHGTKQWFASYHRRVGIESVFGDLKYNVLHLRRGYYRVFGLTAHRLLLGFTLAALNLMILRDWGLKCSTLDFWGKLLGEPEPERRHSKLRHRVSYGSASRAKTTALNGT